MQHGSLRQAGRHRHSPGQGRANTTVEPPPRAGFGISDKTVEQCGHGAHDSGAGRWPNLTHYHTTTTCAGTATWLTQQKSNGSDGIEVILQAGDLLYLPSGANHD
jgi:hypothetical protein